MVKIGFWKEENIFLIHVRDYRKSGGYGGSFHIAEQKGIALTIQVWRKLYEMMDYINEDVEEMAS